MTHRRHFEDYDRMDEHEAIERLSAIAHRTRLAVFRLLVKEGADGLPAGEIARLLSIPPTTMSAHLGILARADLIEARRESRSVIYSLKVEGMQDLLAFLVSDCCSGHPELCMPKGVSQTQG